MGNGTGNRRLAAVIAAAIALVAESVAGQAVAAPPVRAYVDGPYGQIHVRVAGEAHAPTVILVHKMVWSSVEFERVQPLLAARGLRSIAVDLPGYGLSDAPAAQPSAADYADALLPVLKAFRLHRVDVLGVDTGATLAVVFALRHPGAARRVILDGPPLFDAATAHRLLEEPLFDRSPRAGGAEFTDRVSAMRGGIPPGSLSAAAIHEGVLQFFQAAPTYLYAHRAIFSYELKPALLALRAPTLLLDSTGSLLHRAALEAHALRPDFAYVELPFTGMMASYDDPGDWANAVADYLVGTASGPGVAKYKRP